MYVYSAHCLLYKSVSMYCLYVNCFCTIWSTLSRISLTKAHVLWWCDNKSDLIWHYSDQTYIQWCQTQIKCYFSSDRCLFYCFWLAVSVQHAVYAPGRLAFLAACCTSHFCWSALRAWSWKKSLSGKAPKVIRVFFSLSNEWTERQVSRCGDESLPLL